MKKSASDMREELGEALEKSFFALDCGEVRRSRLNLVIYLHAKIAKVQLWEAFRSATEACGLTASTFDHSECSDDLSFSGSISWQEDLAGSFVVSICGSPVRITISPLGRMAEDWL